MRWVQVIRVTYAEYYLCGGRSKPIAAKGAIPFREGPKTFDGIRLSAPCPLRRILCGEKAPFARGLRVHAKSANEVWAVEGDCVMGQKFSAAL
jgi:hypothetical protein